MHVIVDVFLPLSLAFIMFSLGVTLTAADFVRVAKAPGAFLLGVFNQMLLLPLVAYGIAVASGLPGELAVGLMILSFSPGGVTSNIISRLAGADLALSISLTAVVSLVSLATVPALVGLALPAFMGAEAPPFSVIGMGAAVFSIVTVPVLLGLALRSRRPATADAVERVASRVATGLFVVIVAAALASNWALFVENLPVLGPSLVALNVLMLAVGYGSGLLLRVGERRAATIGIETGIQNATLGITVGALLVPEAEGLTAYSLPSGVYGITMYLVTAPFFFWIRRRLA